MQNTVKKWGNSFAARIPKTVVESTGLRLDQKINIEAVDGKIIITPVHEKKEYEIEDLLKLCKPKAMKILKEDEEWLNAQPVGREIW